MNARWLQYFYDGAARAALMSRDANTQVGACIFDEEEKIEVACGWNDLPRGVKHIDDRNERPLKYKMTSHAEISAIANAARTGRSTLNKSLIVTLAPCSQCACAIINSGITKVYSPRPKSGYDRWVQEFEVSRVMFEEAGVEFNWLEDNNVQT